MGALMSAHHGAASHISGAELVPWFGNLHNGTVFNPLELRLFVGPFRLVDKANLQIPHLQLSSPKRPTCREHEQAS